MRSWPASAKSKSPMSKEPKYHPYRASAHSAHELMVGGNEITQKQLEELEGLQNRAKQHLEETEAVAAKRIQLEEEAGVLLADNNALVESLNENDYEEADRKRIHDAAAANSKRLKEIEKEQKALKVKTRPLTTNMEAKLAELIAKRDAPFEMGATAKSNVRKAWLRNQFGYKDVLKTDQMDKGHINEQDGFGLMDELNALTDLRVKNQKRFGNAWAKGTPDHIAVAEQIVEDIKNCFTIATFKSAEFSEIYYGQLQVYMWLTGCRRARLCYVCTDTPKHIIKGLQKRLMWKFGGPEELENDESLNLQYLEAAAQIEHNHTPSAMIDKETGELAAPPEKRAKVYQIDYDPAYIEKLKFRVEKAQEYYDTLTLVPDELRADLLEAA